jgi:CRP/FNR family transcriptional regulator, cyclic AMP receptor protein
MFLSPYCALAIVARGVAGMSEAQGVNFAILIGPQVPRRSFAAGEVIFRQGDPASEMYVVESGEVEIRLDGRLIDTLGSKTIFGEMALVDSAPRSATAKALTDVTLVPVSEKQFLFLVAQTPHFALNVMRVLAGRLRAANK